MRDLESAIVARAEAAGLTVPPAACGQLAAYLDVLGKWNRKINLTALHVDPPDADAVDRLIIEPLVASRWIGPDDGRLLDVGSGGGSPGLPLKILVPAVELVLVESKLRKTSFLREAVRQLDLTGVLVENRRLEDPAVREKLAHSVDVVSLRAVRIDVALMEAVAPLLSSRGRVLYFGNGADSAVGWSQFGLRAVGSDRLPGAPAGVLTVLSL